MSTFQSPQFGLFLVAALVLAITPGPGLAYVVARTVAGGAREGAASSLGTALGGMGHVVAAALGLSVLIAQSAMAFLLVKYIGAAYLVVMGIRILLGASKPAMQITARRAGWSRAFRDGVVVELLNVKTALFFLAFIPQFIDASLPVPAQLILLGSLCVAFNTSADLVAVAVVSRIVRSKAAGQLRAKLLAMASGMTLVFLGLYVVLSKTQRP